MANTKYTQGKDGYWQTKAWDGTYTESGAKHRVNLRSKKSSRDLEKMVRELESSVNERRYTRSSTICVPDYSHKWMDVYKSSLEGNTRAMYLNIIDKHICVLDDVRVNDLNKIHVMTVLNNAAGKSRTQEQILMTLKQVVKSAVSDKLLPANVYTDIFDRVTVRKIRNEKRPLTDSEKRAVLGAELEPMPKAFLYLIYGCGLRRGEALALTRFDFNFKSKMVTINKALAFEQNSPYIKGTKNGVERTVPIPSQVISCLELYCQGLKRPELFYTYHKQYMTKSSYSKMWTQIVKGLDAAGAECNGLTAHMFRHNYCTNLCYQIPTVSIKKIAELIGDTEKMVIEVYNHIILNKEDAAGAIEKALSI